MLNTSCNWLIWPPLAALTAWHLIVSVQMLLLLSHNGSVYAQSDNAIGAHRVFEKTSFSCAGRPAGYYADIETGCQVYHMCDGLGRQFSYSCPNTTLFQQRMLICDHWYMVNCSKAESHYAANLLIGQRDKPFVDDEESNLRTPRPDLLDRPYAPDYSGESFRNQYKQFSAPQNQILDVDQKQRKQEKPATPNQNAPAPQHWKLPAPSRTIEPPAYEAQGTESTTPLSVSQQRFPSTTAVPRVSHRQPPAATYRPTVQPTVYTTTTATPTPTPLRRQSPVSSFGSAPLLQRQHETLNVPHVERDDLGTSHSTRYNTSSDFSSAEVVASDKKAIVGGRKTQTTKTTVGASVNTLSSGAAVKAPSKVYEPPFVYPIYNQDDANEAPSSTTAAPLPTRESSAAPFSTNVASTQVRTGGSNAPVVSTTTSTTRQPLSRPTTLAGKPFTAANVNAYTTPTTPTPLPSHAQTAAGRNQNNIRYDVQKPSKDVRFQPPTPRPPVNSAKTLKPPTTTATAPRVEASPLDYHVPTKNRYNAPTPFSSAPAATQPGGQPAIRRQDSRADVPSKDLLPPYAEFVQHDDATTQGPPIYYEWKVPSNGLEPPKLDPPYGVDGREYPDSAIDYNQISASNGGDTAGGFTPILSFSIDQGARPTSAPSATVTSKSTNPFLVTARKQKQRHDANVPATRTPTSRAVKDTAVPNEVIRTPSQARKTATTNVASVNTLVSPTTEADIEHLREELSVPDFAFPLETIGRTGYLATDTYNSFQLKIPERRSTDDAEAENDHLHWFGENPQCPECHPSYVVPGTCEPCLKR